MRVRFCNLKPRPHRQRPHIGRATPPRRFALHRNAPALAVWRFTNKRVITQIRLAIDQHTHRKMRA